MGRRHLNKCTFYRDSNNLVENRFKACNLSNNVDIKVSLQVSGETRDEREKNAKNYIEKEYGDRSKQIFVDASTKRENCAFAFYDEASGKIFAKLIKVSRNTGAAEFLGNRAALEYIDINNMSNMKIFTDNRSACDIFIAQSEKEEVDEAMIHNLKILHERKIKIVFAYGHIGIEGIKIAEEVAKNVAAEYNNDIINVCGKTFRKSHNETCSDYIIYEIEKNVTTSKASSQEQMFQLNIIFDCYLIIYLLFISFHLLLPQQVPLDLNDRLDLNKGRLMMICSYCSNSIGISLDNFQY